VYDPWAQPDDAYEVEFEDGSVEPSVKKSSIRIDGKTRRHAKIDPGMKVEAKDRDGQWRTATIVGTPRVSNEKMKLFVEVPGVSVDPVVVHVDSGTQSVKWLGVSLSQRFQQTVKPHGSRRGREHHSIREGFYVPGAVTNAEGEILDPSLPLNRCFKSGDTAVVKMSVSYDGRCTPHMAVNKNGCPVYSQFYQVAKIPLNTH
jgi:hypothetical protein